MCLYMLLWTHRTHADVLLLSPDRLEAAANAAESEQLQLSAQCQRMGEARDAAAAQAAEAAAALAQLQAAHGALQQSNAALAAQAAAGGGPEALLAELAAASQRMGALQTQVATLQAALDEQANRSQTVLQVRSLDLDCSLRAVAVGWGDVGWVGTADAGRQALTKGTTARPLCTNALGTRTALITVAI